MRLVLLTLLLGVGRLFLIINSETLSIYPPVWGFFKRMSYFVGMFANLSGSLNSLSNKMYKQLFILELSFEKIYSCYCSKEQR